MRFVRKIKELGIHTRSLIFLVAPSLEEGVALDALRLFIALSRLQSGNVRRRPVNAIRAIEEA